MSFEQLEVKDMQCSYPNCPEYTTILEYTKEYPIKYCTICGSLLVEIK